MEPRRIKGNALLGALAWVSLRFGTEARAEMVESVAATWPDVFDRRLRATRSYPYDAYRDLLAAVESLLETRASTETLYDIGRWTGDRDVGGILRIVAVFATPEAVVNRGFNSWGRAYWSRFCSAGTVRLADSRKGGAAIALDDFPDIAPQHCQLMEGWWEAMATAAGAKGARISQSLCVHRGDACCEFRGSWLS